ncbi:ABC transporter permease [uncultured Arthrobacter sp.]|uniref:ABC transporter permease n=1 Tax=uncultured Arthrobacter sp. TaxID=114050 RepID=UPI0025CDEA1C|nr:ABC transporter permease [uncultured Arthrobacter sp.]
MPYVLLVVMLLVFVVLPVVAGQQVTSFNYYNLFQVFASLGLLSVALGLTMIAGEFDLSVLGTYAFAGLVAVKLGADDPVVGLLAALVLAALIGALQGALVAWFRLPSAAVSLGVYIALLGLTATISDSKTVPYNNLNVSDVLDRQYLEIFSLRSIIAILAVAAIAVTMTYTRFGRDVRAIGSDRRASLRIGVRVDSILVVLFVLSALLSALGGSMLALSLAAATPDPGFDPLIFALTAVLLGGVSLRGGTGTVLGIAAGILTLSLLRELLTVLATPTYVSSLATGGLLLVVAFAAAPGLNAWWLSMRRPTKRVAEPPSLSRVG